MRRKYYFIANNITRPILSRYGVPLENENVAALYADADHWEAIDRDFREKGIRFIRVELEFSEEELRASSWLIMRSMWHWEYPQPEKTFKDFTYGRGNYCIACGAKFAQDGPFKIKKAPSWRNRHFLMLNWVDDEIFVKRETYDLLVKEQFVQRDHPPVVQGRENRAVDTIVQMKMTEVPGPGYMNPEAVQHVCPACSMRKYFIRGENKKTYNEEIFRNARGHVYRSHERFGSPDLHVAARDIIISQELYRFLRTQGFDQLLEFQPIDLGRSGGPVHTHT